MKLTPEQEAVVALSSGRHLVLAPPGSGKTEMLSRRIIGAVKSGVDPARMLCATFTNRAAFEMRDRVMREGGDLVLPDVGNLHHFCHSFLASVGRLRPGVHVLDEVQQEEFAKELADVLARELREGAAAGAGCAFGTTVVRGVKGICGPSAGNANRVAGELNPARVEYIRRLFEGYFADAFKNERNPYAELLSGMAVVHQRRIGIPPSLVRPFPSQVAELASEGVIDGMERAYSGLKRKFRSIDFDDLLNETYLYLESHPLPEERRFTWVQIDEVQDLSPIQWRIVRRLAAPDGVCVYFGDVEQAIFSFLGASADCFAEATSDCERHCFRKNFRATPLLLEVLMRYSLGALFSEWEFLPSPANPDVGDGILELSTRRLEGRKPGIHEDFNFGPVLRRADEMLKSGVAENIAILVRTNKAADVCEQCVKELNWRYAKVSGVDLFSYAPMRDFMAFVSLFTGHVPMTAWASLARRFSRVIHNRTQARYFVRGMFAARWNPESLLGERSPVGFMPGARPALWALRNHKTLANMRKALRPAYAAVAAKMVRRCSLREVFDAFAAVALDGPQLYSTRELSPSGLVDGDGKDVDLQYFEGVAIAKERIEKFLRYADCVYAEDLRPLGEILVEDWGRLSKLKEADLLVGDEKIVISTIHKAKGRQFDAVFIPDVRDVVSSTASDEDEARRLLYVAMSRAKRHLSMWEADEPSVAPLIPCFERGYESYYLRKLRGSDLSGDWLAAWERLAEMDARRECDDELVSRYVASRFSPVVCMALRVLRWSGDAALRRRIYVKLVGEDKKGDVLPRTTACMADCGMFDVEAAAQVRAAALRAESRRGARSALGYFSRMSERSRDGAVEAIGDFVYSRYPEIRVAAAGLISSLGIARWDGVITGAKSDFDRLAKHQDAEHEQSIRDILSANPHPEAYARHLRGIIAARAMRSGHKLTA